VRCAAIDASRKRRERDGNPPIHAIASIVPDALRPYSSADRPLHGVRASTVDQGERRVLLGIDVGTSSAKVLVIDESGRTIADASAGYPVDRPHDGWSEQTPSVWWRSVASGIRAALASDPRSPIHPDQIKAVGLSGQMHGSVFLDRRAIDGARDGAIEALRPALLWNDQRTQSQCESIERLAGGPAALVRAVGNRALTGFTLPKILWLREHEPAVFAHLASVVLPKDFIRLQLTGSLGTDVGDASGMLLLDLDRRTWRPEICAAVGLDPALLPPLTESACVIGSVTPWAAAQTGLRAGTPVVAGTGDNQAGAIGAGVVKAGLVLATLGTSGVVYAHSDQPRKDIAPGLAPGRVQANCAANGTKDRPGQWSNTGCMLSAAGSLHWARDVIAPGAPFQTLMEEAATVAPGCDGLVFLPYLSGERCPYPDPLARGGWIGLRGHHTRAHLIRAVIEGVTFGMAQMLELVRALPVPVERIRLGGGGSKSEFWRQVQADVYGLPVSALNNEEGPAFGVALLAGVGVGVWPTVEAACAAAIHEVRTYEPSPHAAEWYRGARAVFDRLYEDLRPGMHALSAP
jgi:xylulokinase